MSDHNSERPTGRGSQRRRERQRLQERGISDVVAFVLIFSIVIVSGTIVATAGVDQLTELRDFEQVQSSQQAMEVAASDLNHLQQGGLVTNLAFAPNGGSIWVNQSSLQMNVSGPGIDTDEINGTYQVNSLEHRVSRGDQDVTLAYESGAVVRSDGAAFQYEPRWRNDEDTVIVTIVSLRTESDDITVGSGGFSEAVALEPRRGIPQGAPASDPGQTIQIGAEANSTEQQQWYVQLNETQTEPVNVTVNVSGTANPDQWARALGDAGWDEDDNGEYEYETGAEETLLIRHVVIELS